MKKVIFGFFLLWISLTNCEAQTLNYYTDTSIKINYQINQITKNFEIYTNNLTGNLLYTTSPNLTISYQTDYLGEENPLGQIASNTQNKIKKYIKETQNATDEESKIYNYINTQMLIWNTFHPKLKITIEDDTSTLKKYKHLLDEASITPNWIHNYEIETELFLEIEDIYSLSSKDCKIEKNEEKTHIYDCKHDAIITVKEEGKSKINAYQDSIQKEKIIESGEEGRIWTFQILKKNNPPKESITEEIEETIFPNKQEEIPNNQKIVVANVPNTYESQNFCIWYGFLYLLILEKYLI